MKLNLIFAHFQEMMTTAAPTTMDGDCVTEQGEEVEPGECPTQVHLKSLQTSN